MDAASTSRDALRVMRHARALDLGPERLSVLALVPAIATGFYYVLPPGLQELATIQFLPQALAYGSLIVWIRGNHGCMARLGLRSDGLRQGIGQGIGWGLGVGLALGLCNVWVLLRLVPWLGADIQFLTETAHAQVPVLVMLPWAIILIAMFVELNFRGFQLGRWLALCGQSNRAVVNHAGPVVAVGISSIVFAFDPFMVATFQHLHWIATWDGVVWGALWARLRNLYATIIAHAVEVIILYSAIRVALM